jgi:hypothetical protein
MSSVTCAVDIAAPAAALFALSQDYSRRLHWDPFLREARFLDGAQFAALGVRAWCVAHNGLGMETTYVSYQPPTVVAVKMTRGPSIISSFAGSWRFTPVPIHNGLARTHVVFRYQVSGRPRALAFLLDPLLALIFRRETQRRLHALKRAVETTSILADMDTETASTSLPAAPIGAPTDLATDPRQSKGPRHA